MTCYANTKILNNVLEFSYLLTHESIVVSLIADAVTMTGSGRSAFDHIDTPTTAAMSDSVATHAGMKGDEELLLTFEDFQQVLKDRIILKNTFLIVLELT